MRYLFFLLLLSVPAFASTDECKSGVKHFNRDYPQYHVNVTQWDETTGRLEALVIHTPKDGLTNEDARGDFMGLLRQCIVQGHMGGGFYRASMGSNESDFLCQILNPVTLSMDCGKIEKVTLKTHEISERMLSSFRKYLGFEK